MMRRPFTVLAGVALAGALIAGCGAGDDRSVGIGQVDDTSTTSASSTTTTVAALVTTTTVAPPSAAPPCTDAALRSGYLQTYGAEPAGSLSPRCLAGWALASYSNGIEAPTFVLFHAEAGAWVAKSEGVAHVCEDQPVPPRVAAYIGCDT